MASVTVKLAEAPSAMLPKLNAAGVIVRPDWMPVPVSAAVSGNVVALVETLSTPVRTPVVVGVNDTWTVQLVFAASGDPTTGHVPLAV